MITGKNYIGGELSSNSSVSFKTFNPILNIENSITFFEASDIEIENLLNLPMMHLKYLNKYRH